MVGKKRVQKFKTAYKLEEFIVLRKFLINYIQAKQGKAKRGNFTSTRD